MYTKTHGGFKVKTVKDKALGGYEGMNYYAAKELHFGKYPGKKVIEVSDRYHGAQRERIIKHEVKEAELMRHHCGYFCAHRRANKAERRPWWEK